MGILFVAGACASIAQRARLDSALGCLGRAGAESAGQHAAAPTQAWPAARTPGMAGTVIDDLAMKLGSLS